VFVAALSPWPADMDGDSEFALRIIDASGGQEEWYKPLDVEVVRVEGASADTSVAGVTLTQTPTLDIPELATVSAADVRGELETNGGNCRQALTTLGPAAFSALAGGNGPSASSLHVAPETDTARPASFEVIVGSADVAQRGLCKIFRWDA
jgi:hypothetical protein